MKMIRVLKSDIGSRWRKRTKPQENQDTKKHEFCPRCGAQVASSRASLREMAGNQPSPYGVAFRPKVFALVEKRSPFAMSTERVSELDAQ
jgi:hypothetical protein